MKKLLFLSLIIIAFNSCSKDGNTLPEPEVNEEEQAFEDSSFKGNVDLETAGLTYNEIEVISSGESARVLEGGKYYFDSQRNENDIEEIIVTDKATQSVVYYVISDGSNNGISNKSANKNNSGNTINDYLNSEETAFSLIIRAMPLNSIFSKQQIRELKKTIKDIAPKELNNLVQAIEKNIKDKSYFENYNEIPGLVKVIMDFLLDDYIDLVEEVLPQEESTGGGGAWDDNIFPQFEMANSFGQVKVEEGEFNTNSKEWDVNCTIYNALPMYMAVTEANVTKDSNSNYDFVYDTNDITHIIEPYNASSFYKSFTTVSGVKDFYNELKQRVNSNNWGGYVEDPTNTTKKNKNVELNFSKNHNSLFFISPEKSRKVLIINIISQTTSFTELLMTYDNESSELKDKKNVTLDKILLKVVKNKNVEVAYTTYIQNPTLENFKNFGTIVLDKFVEEILKESSIGNILKIKKNINSPVDAILKKYAPHLKFAIDATKKASDFGMLFAHINKKRSHFLYITKPNIKNLEPAISSENIETNATFTINFYTPMTETEITPQFGTIVILDEGNIKIEDIGSNYEWLNDNLTLKFQPTKLKANKTYRVVIKPQVFKGKYDFLAFNELTVINGKYEWTFTTSSTATPLITKVEPLTATLGVETTFTVTGTNLPEGLAYWVADLENITEVAGGNDTTRYFKGTPSNSAGTKQGVVKDAGGTELHNFTVTFVQASPSITSITPNQATLGTETTFTVRGTNLPEGLAYWVADLENITEVAGGNDTTRYFKGMPSNSAGTKQGVVKDAGGTELHNFTVTFVQTSPSITSITPNQATLGTETTFTVRGTNLPEGLAYWVADLDTITEVAGGNDTTRYFKGMPSNSAGTKQGVVKDAPGGTELHNFTVTFVQASPSITSITPNQATLGTETTFTVRGTNLPEGLAYWVADLENITEVAGGNDTTRYFKGMPSNSAGTKQGVVKDAPGGTELHNFTVTFVQASPSITSITPNQATLGTETTFTVTGTNLPEGLAYWVADLENITEVAGGNDTTRYFKGMPSNSAGTKQGVVKDAPGGTELHNFTVTFVQASPSITSISPTQATLGTETTFTVTGTNLPEGLAYWVADLENITEVAGGNDTTRYFKGTPSNSAGTKQGVVKDAGGTELHNFTVTFVQASPSITSITPTQATLGTETTFTVRGTNLPEGLAYWVADLENITEVAGGNDTTRYFKGMPSNSTGTKQGVVKDAGGTELHNFTVTFVQASPSITSITPNQATLGTETTFTVRGTNLPEGLAYWVADLENITEVAGGNDTTRYFKGMPSNSAGTKQGVVKDAGGTELHNFTVTFVQTSPSITSITPNQATLGTETTFTVRGTNLPEGLAYWVADLDTITEVAGGNDTTRYFKGMPSNSAGTKQGVVKDAPGGTELHNFTVTFVQASPSITSITPNQATLGTETTFTVRGTNLPEGLAYWVADLENITEVAGGNDTTRYFKGMPSNSAGTKQGVVKDAPGGTELHNFTVTFVQASPSITSITPNQATLGTETTFTVTGTNLPEGLAYWVADLENITEVAGGNDTTRYFKGMPSNSAGTKQGVVKDAPGGTELHNFTVTFVQASPSITSISPTQATLGTETTFTVTGTNLPEGLAYWVADLENITEVAGGNDTTRYFKGTPSNSAGTKQGVVKDAGGTELHNFTVTFVQASPSITSITPTQATLGTETTFTVRGTNLPEGLAYWVADLENITEVAGGNDTTRYFKGMPSNSTGTKQGVVKDAGGTELHNFTVTFVQASPSITSITPNQATLGTETTFTVRGTNLPEGLAYWVADLENITEVAGGNDTTRYFKGMPSNSTGTKQGVVKDAGGTELHNFTVTFVQASPSITSITPNQATLGTETTFTVTGTNLPEGLAYWVADLENITEVAGGNDTTRYFKGMPSNSAGTKQGVVKDAGGTELHNFTVTFVQASPSITSISPTQATLGTETTFTVRGTNLPEGLAYWVADLDTITEVAGGNDTTRYFKGTPSNSAGTKQGVVKDAPGGTELHNFTVTFVQTSPSITSITPTQATLGTETTFTVTGTNLPEGLAYWVADLENITEVAGGNDTTRYFKGMPSNSAGTKQGVVKDAPGGNTLYNFSVEFKQSSSGTFPGETVTVAGGTFQMGSNNGSSDEQPIHTVTVSSFNISKYEITNAQYAAFMNAIGANSNGSHNGTKYLQMNSSDCQISYLGGQFVADTGKENHPVVAVSWYGAKAYAEHYGGRLPTEAEWEFAARGGNSSNGYTYSGSNTIDDVAWYSSNSGGSTHRIGTKNANELGLHDMSGNVWEWCNDWYSSSYYNSSPQNNPQGPTSGTYRVTRGGSWYSSAYSSRVAFRYGDGPTNANDYLGFRPVFIP